MNAHQQAIQIMEDIYSGKRDAMSCLFTLCRVEPEAMVRALVPPLVKQPAGWTDLVMTYLHNNNKVGAIKEVRVHRGLGLREAKDVVDAVSGITDPYDARRWLEEGYVQQPLARQPLKEWMPPEPTTLGSLLQQRVREIPEVI